MGVSLKRMDQFLRLPERPPPLDEVPPATAELKSQQDSVSSMTAEQSLENNFLKDDVDVRLILKDAAFSWGPEHFSIAAVSATIRVGTLCGIAGPVGSGKTSFLLALL